MLDKLVCLISMLLIKLSLIIASQTYFLSLSNLNKTLMSDVFQFIMREIVKIFFTYLCHNTNSIILFDFQLFLTLIVCPVK